MFCRLPIFQRLLSWSKPDAPVEPGTRAYEWYDHNSLVAEESVYQALCPALMDRSFVVPSRQEMERGSRPSPGCPFRALRLPLGRDATRTTTADRSRHLRRRIPRASGRLRPRRDHALALADSGHRDGPALRRHAAAERVQGSDRLRHREAELRLRGRRRPASWARRVILGSPRPVQTAVIAQASVRVRYLQPYEDAALGGGFALDLAVERIEARVRLAHRRRRNDSARSGRPRGGRGHRSNRLLDPDSRPRRPRRANGRPGAHPVPDPVLGERARVGDLLRGNATQGAPGLRKHGVGASSPAVHGFRYNARVMARHLARTTLGLEVPTERVEQDQVSSSKS